MSNSIWKTGYPTYRNDNIDEIIVREYKRWAADGVFYLVDDCTELPNRWAYLLDIIAQADKAERLQKAVDNYEKVIVGAMFAPDVGDVTAGMLEESHKTIKQLIKENQ